MAKYLKRELKMLNHFNNGDVTKWTVSYQCHKKSHVNLSDERRTYSTGTVPFFC